MMARALVGALVVLALLLPQLPVHAADTLTVSVTPPLFQLSLGPGEFWASTLKVVNTNAYDVTYYATVVNFEPTGERGTGNFKPIVKDFGETQDVHSLASWITITDKPIPVKAGQSLDIPFEVSIPQRAEPGGHYAAILVGTKPATLANEGPRISVSSYVSSLFFVKLRGDVREEGRIREFTTDRTFYEKPDATFKVRFENTGNVHVRPQGDIEIYTMWGKERGKIMINDQPGYGNVLPESVRRFDFKWTGEFSPFDIGRYKAVLTLGYGDEVKRSTSAVTYFWVVPVMPVVETVGGFLVFVLVLAYFVRRYVRRVIALEESRTGRVVKEPAPRVSRIKNRSNHSFLGKYAVLIAFLIYIGVSGAVFFWFFGEALVDSRTYEVQELKTGTEVGAEIPEND